MSAISVSPDSARLLSDATVLALRMKIGVVKWGTSRHTVQAVNRLAEDGIDDLSNYRAQLDWSSTRDGGQLPQKNDLESAVVWNLAVSP